MEALDKKVNYYLIPGMGADHRLYQKFRLEHGPIHYLNWIEHGKSKTLADYAALMSERITTENNVIVGSSMGGMVAVEMSRIVKPLATVLVSAPTGRQEFPRILKTVNAIKLHKLVTPGQVMKIAGLADTFMGFKTKEQRALFYEMLKGNGPEFLHFSVGAVLEWRNKQLPEGDFIQIIGSLDRLFKAPKADNAFVIEGGGHFTAFEKADEVSQIINSYIAKKISSLH